MQHRSRSNSSGFTLIELLIVVVIVGILALAAIPLISSNTKDARRSEAEQMAGVIANQVRYADIKNGGDSVMTLTGAIEANGAGMNVAQITGQYFEAAQAVTLDSGIYTITLTPHNVTSDGTLTVEVPQSGGPISFEWVD